MQVNIFYNSMSEIQQKKYLCRKLYIKISDITISTEISIIETDTFFNVSLLYNNIN